jgi:hypothetical protein
VLKLRLRTADFGTVGFALLENVAIEPTIPSRIKNPIVIARRDPTKVPRTIFRKFFISVIFILFTVFRLIKKEFGN